MTVADKPKPFVPTGNAKAGDHPRAGQPCRAQARANSPAGAEFSPKAPLPPAARGIKRTHQTPTERWQSGRMRRSRKPLSVQADPGFESLSLRHTSLHRWRFFMALPVRRVADPWCAKDRMRIRCKSRQHQDQSSVRKRATSTSGADTPCSLRPENVVQACLSRNILSQLMFGLDRNETRKDVSTQTIIKTKTDKKRMQGDRHAGP